LTISPLLPLPFFSSKKFLFFAARPDREKSYGEKREKVGEKSGCLLEEEGKEGRKERKGGGEGFVIFTPKKYISS